MKRRAFFCLVAVAALLVAGCGGATTGLRLSISSDSPSVTNYENVESSIDGHFEGWDGDTVFELENGQVWQQTSYDYTYHYAYDPDVLIYDDNGAWKLSVEGVDDVITVERLR